LDNSLILRPQPGAQERFLSTPADIAIYGGSAGSGKLLNVNTQIPTPFGFRRLGDLVAGDLVFDENGIPCTITIAHPVVIPDVAYRLTFDDGSEIDACSEHEWLTLTINDLIGLRSKSEEWKEKRRLNRASRATGTRSKAFNEMISARNKKRAIDLANTNLPIPKGSIKTTQEIVETLEIRGRANHAIPVCKPFVFDEIELPIPPYTLGAWLGDGTSSNSQITSADIEVIDRIRKDGFEVTKQKSNKYGWNIALFCQKTKRNNIAKNKHIPDIYFRSSVLQRLELLKGLMDTDGYSRPDCSTCEFTSTSIILAEQVFDLVISLGCKATMRSKPAKLYEKVCGTSYTIAFSTDLPVFNLSRKLLNQQESKARKTVQYRYIKKCERIESVPMRCLTVDSPSHLFLCGKTAIPTHNSFALLLEPIRHIHNPYFGGVIFRRESKELTMEGGLVSKALNMYPYLGGVYRSQPTPSFTFPSGARISFGHLNQEHEVLAWMGSEICYEGFDEGNHFTDYQITYMLSRNRSTCGVKPYVRITCNPDADSWMAEFLKWWIDQSTGYPIKERGGVIRYLIRVEGQRVWGDSVEELVEQYHCDPLDAKSVTFIPATITDNPILLLKDPGYLANLKGLSFVERSRLLDGNWKIRPAAGMYFPRHDVTIIDWVPTDVTKWVRSWDLAASEEREGKHVDWTVGMLMGRRSNGKIVIADIVRVRRKAAEVRALVRRLAENDGKDTWIILPQDPGQSGKPIYEEELILMADGSLKKLKDVVEGDFVIGKDAFPHMVTDIHIHGLLQTLKITTECGRVIRAAYDHPFLTTEGWIEAGDLTTNDSLGLLAGMKINLSTTRTAEEFRLAGYFVGDGSVGIKKGSISSDAGFCCNDPIQIEDFKHCVKSIGGEVVIRGHRGVNYGTTGLQQWLRDTTLAGKTAYNKRVPSWVFSSPNHLIAEFIGAYFACDGTISKKGDSVIFYSVSKELLTDIQHLLLRLGISSRLKQKNGQYLKTRHVSFLLVMSQQDDGYRRFANRIPIHHTMKKQRLTELSAKSRFRRFDEKYIPDKIKSIAKDELLPCRCLSVESDKSFIVNDVVVHNCQIDSYREILSEFTVLSRTITKNKVVMAEPAAALWQQGNIEIVRGKWNEDFLSEGEGFPEGRHDDQIDSLSSGCQRLPGYSIPDYSQSGLSSKFKEFRRRHKE